MARALAIAVVLAALLAPAPAQAGTYDVYACRLPDGGPAPAGGWGNAGLLAGPFALRADGCPLTVSVAPSATTTRPITIGWRFDAQPNRFALGSQNCDGDVVANANLFLVLPC